MEWLKNQVLSPVARRVAGQAAAALVGLGMAQAHQHAVEALIAWVLISALEVAASDRNRRKVIDQAKAKWGQN